MPELPEVQTIVDDLKRRILGRRIKSFWSDTPRIFHYTTIGRVRSGIRDLKIQSVDRRGKNIVFQLKELGTRKQGLGTEKILVIHPKLTGHLLIGKWGKGNEKWPYIRAAFTLDGGLTLAFSDVRKFGKIMFGNRKKIESLPDLKNLGPDPLSQELTISKFKDLIEREKRKIKLVLLDQEVIAGIGNIYSDEALWMAKIHPFTPAHRLTEKQLKILYAAIKKVLRQSLRVRGSSLRNYRDTEGKEGGYIKFRRVYDREGLHCYRCKTPVKRIKIGVRSTHYCPKCQRP